MSSRKSNCNHINNSQPSKRRRLSHTQNIVTLLGPSRARPSAVLPKRRPPRPEVAPANNRQSSVSRGSGSTTTRPQETTSSSSSSTAAAAATEKPLPKLVDNPLSSENIEAALCLMDRNTKRKRNSFDQVLQAFHDLYRWSRLPNKDHRAYFRNEFVWELDGISRVMKFLKAHNMGDEFLCQLLQTNLPFNE